MGICSSCLRARDRRSQGHEPSETQPLLGDNNTGENDEAEEGNDQLSLQRQQELANIVHKTHEYFIDVSGYPNADSTEQTTDVSSLMNRLAEHEGEIELIVPEVEDLTTKEQQQLDIDIKNLDRASKRHKIVESSGQSPANELKNNPLESQSKMDPTVEA